MADELRDQSLPLLLPKSEVGALDEWRRQQPDLPSRSEAIRRLIEAGMRATQQQPAEKAKG